MRRKTKQTAPPVAAGNARASWRGMLRFGLVAFPVQAFNARSSDSGDIAFHQLHADCGRRIRYKKECPVHGAIGKDEIVKAYEYGKGKYVEVESSELDELRSERDKALTIDTFIESIDFDPLYYDGRMYYLVPDGESALEPYAVFLRALERQHRYGVGQVVFSGKEQVAVIRPYENLLHMALLNYESEMRSPEQSAVSLPTVRSADRKVHMAEQIIRNWTDEEFDFAQYVDRYQAKVRELIDAKIAGDEVVTPEAEEEPEVINLMDALKKSMGPKVRSAASTAARPKSAKRGAKRRSPAKPRTRRRTKAG